MPRRFSDVLGVSHEALESEGVFDAFVDIDSRFHIDPHLLTEVATPELRGSYKGFRHHFDNVIRLLKASQRRGDKMWRGAVQRLIFREVSYIGLGYAAGGTSGNAIGETLANNLAVTASEIIGAGIEDPTIFELLGLLEEGIGADRISDMTAIIILSDLMSFTERVATKLGAQMQATEVDRQLFNLPYDHINSRPIVFVPKGILRTLPIAEDWSDIDVVCAHNERLRSVVNQIIGNTWKQATTRVNKLRLRSVLLGHPDVLRDLLNQYKEKPARPYDFNSDPEGEIHWFEIAKEFVTRYPLDLNADASLDVEKLTDVVTRICHHFKRLVEANGLVQLFYDNEHVKNERAAQLLFFGIADAYCEANNLDISREPNAGRGPVDFKISHGHRFKVNVEVKYSKNGKLRNGYSQQLPTYDKAEQTLHSIYLIIQTAGSSAIVEELIKFREQTRNEGRRAPDIIVVDGRIYPSASKL